MILRRVLFSAAIASAAMGVFSSCESKPIEVEYIPVQFTENGAWSFIDSKGERVGNQEWEFEPSVTRGNIFTALTDSGLCVYHWEDKEAKPFEGLTNLASAGVYNDGLIPVTPAMERIHIVDGDGQTKFVLEPIGGKEISTCSSKFCEGLLVISTIDGKSGVIDSEGNVVVAPKFTSISDFNGGYALAVNYNYENDNGPSYFIIDSKGNVKPVGGKFGYPEGDCGIVPSFVNNVAEVAGEPDTTQTEYTPTMVRISTDGKVTPVKTPGFMTVLDNGSTISSSYGESDNSVWVAADGKQIMKTDGYYLSGIGRYVYALNDGTATVYDENGKELIKQKSVDYAQWPGGNFGPVLGRFENETTQFTLYTPEGKPIEGASYFGVGLNEMINPFAEEDMSCGETVTSAYVDIAAAAGKLAQMVTAQSVKGKDRYYIGQSVKEILAGENARFYSGSDRTISIPTDSTGQLASGAGFWVSGSARSSANVVAPTYKHYFEVHHYDYFGRAWGWNRKRQVGVQFNSAAKVASFDLQLHTNHASGEALRESIGRRLKADGYVLIDSTPNYDEYNNGGNTVIIYGNRESRGIGALVGVKSSSMTDTEKSALAATLF